MKKLVFVFAVLATMAISSCCGLSKQEAETSNDSIATTVDTVCCDTVDTLVVDSVRVR